MHVRRLAWQLQICTCRWARAAPSRLAGVCNFQVLQILRHPTNVFLGTRRSVDPRQPGPAPAATAKFRRTHAMHTYGTSVHGRCPRYCRGRCMYSPGESKVARNDPYASLGINIECSSQTLQRCHLLATMVPRQTGDPLSCLPHPRNREAPSIARS